jgi:hypothetical protein
MTETNAALLAGLPGDVRALLARPVRVGLVVGRDGLFRDASGKRVWQAVERIETREQDPAVAAPGFSG